MPPRKTPGRDGRPYRRAAARLKRAEHPCWLCGMPIDPELKSPHPYSFTADHVVPIARGGAVLGEIRPAHRVCNQRRGAGKPVASQRSRNW